MALRTFAVYDNNIFFKKNGFIILYKNIYYILLYVGLVFFLLGIYVSIFQLELFTAFLWLIECSVLFVFLLLLFFLNVKGVYSYTNLLKSQTIVILNLFLFFIVVSTYFEN